VAVPTGGYWPAAEAESASDGHMRSFWRLVPQAAVGPCLTSLLARVFTVLRALAMHVVG
jgi:hypothetical protein